MTYSEKREERPNLQLYETSHEVNITNRLLLCRTTCKVIFHKKGVSIDSRTESHEHINITINLLRKFSKQLHNNEFTKERRGVLPILRPCPHF